MRWAAAVRNFRGVSVWDPNAHEILFSSVPGADEGSVSPSHCLNATQDHVLNAGCRVNHSLAAISRFQADVELRDGQRHASAVPSHLACAFVGLGAQCF